jgi:hypothetical protein
MEEMDVANLIFMAVERAADAGTTLSPSHEANLILESHPDCSVPFDILRHDLVRAATLRGVPVEVV